MRCAFDGISTYASRDHPIDRNSKPIKGHTIRLFQIFLYRKQGPNTDDATRPSRASYQQTGINSWKCPPLAIAAGSMFLVEDSGSQGEAIGSESVPMPFRKSLLPQAQRSLSVYLTRGSVSSRRGVAAVDTILEQPRRAFRETSTMRKHSRRSRIIF